MNTIDSVTRTITVANVMDSLRRKIILGGYQEGAMVTEVALAREFATSRGTIRTAMQMLESEGLIETLENGRKKICSITEKFVSDLYNTRALLECEAIRAIMGKKYVNFGPLYEAVDRLKNPPAAWETEGVYGNDVFHRTLLEMSDNRPLLRCWNTIEPTIRALARFHLNTLDPEAYSSDYVRTHSQLLELLITRDQKIEKEMRDHIEQEKRDALSGLQLNRTS